MNHRENDIIRLRQTVEADVIGQRKKITIPAHSEGVVVFVHGDPDQPTAYEVEFYVASQNVYALATLEPNEV